MELSFQAGDERRRKVLVSQQKITDMEIHFESVSLKRQAQKYGRRRLRTD
jgi:hypothetical protein